VEDKDMLMNMFNLRYHILGGCSEADMLLLHCIHDLNTHLVRDDIMAVETASILTSMTAVFAQRKALQFTPSRLTMVLSMLEMLVLPRLIDTPLLLDITMVRLCVCLRVSVCIHSCVHACVYAAVVVYHCSYSYICKQQKQIMIGCGVSEKHPVL